MMAVHFNELPHEGYRLHSVFSHNYIDERKRREEKEWYAIFEKVKSSDEEDEEYEV